MLLQINLYIIRVRGSVRFRFRVIDFRFRVRGSVRFSFSCYSVIIDFRVRRNVRLIV